MLLQFLSPCLCRSVLRSDSFFLLLASHLYLWFVCFLSLFSLFFYFTFSVHTNIDKGFDVSESIDTLETCFEDWWRVGTDTRNSIFTQKPVPGWFISPSGKTTNPFLVMLTRSFCFYWKSDASHRGLLQGGHLGFAINCHEHLSFPQVQSSHRTLRYLWTEMCGERFWTKCKLKT